MFARGGRRSRGEGAACSGRRWSFSKSCLEISCWHRAPALRPGPPGRGASPGAGVRVAGVAEPSGGAPPLCPAQECGCARQGWASEGWGR